MPLASARCSISGPAGPDVIDVPGRLHCGALEVGEGVATPAVEHEVVGGRGVARSFGQHRTQLTAARIDHADRAAARRRDEHPAIRRDCDAACPQAGLVQDHARAPVRYDGQHPTVIGIVEQEVAAPVESRALQRRAPFGHGKPAFGYHGGQVTLPGGKRHRPVHARIARELRDCRVLRMRRNGCRKREGCGQPRRAAPANHAIAGRRSRYLSSVSGYSRTRMPVAL